jgi:hypothetical protein
LPVPSVRFKASSKRTISRSLGVGQLCAWIDGHDDAAPVRLFALDLLGHRLRVVARGLECVALRVPS